MRNAFGEGAARGFAAARATEALLRAVGATQVQILRQAALTGTLEQRQLGQAQPQYDVVVVGPAAVSAECVPPAALRVTAILPARMVRKLAEQEGAANGTEWLTSARGILHEDTVLRIVKVETEFLAGVECFYRVTAEA